MNASPRYNPEQPADVCLLLEGTYPYIRGGVSTWVKQLIEKMPDLSFSIVFLGASQGDYKKLAYELPDNLIHLELHYLLGESRAQNSSSKGLSLLQKFGLGNRTSNGETEDKFERCSALHTQLAATSSFLTREPADQFTELLTAQGGITENDLMHSEEAWEIIREKYHDAPEGLDFNHFFWTVRSMHEPLFTLADIASNIPVAAVYHAVSTGYAGFLGSMCQSLTGKPFIISEHGIYTKERELDLAQVDWIPADVDPFNVGLNDNMNYLRSVWIRFFRSLGKMSYSNASQIFTLFNGNRLRQIADGAQEHRITIIPNGVDVERFRQVRRSADAPIPPVLGLVGRVVPIKDIKTFIRAMRIIRAEIPDAEGWLIGPEDEDPDYTLECRELAQSLELQDVVKFKGFQKPDDMFPQLGLNVLTSVSEGQPLVVLEGYAAGLPAIATDVGSCVELVHGISAEDQALGSAGAVVPIANPALFAQEAIKLLTDHDAWMKASASAVQRVETWYDERDMVSRYQDVYLSEMGRDSQRFDKAG